MCQYDIDFKGFYTTVVVLRTDNIVLVLNTLNTSDDNQKLRINEGIRASELRVLEDGRESTVMSREDAIERAYSLGLDLIEISAKANPPVAKITDYGKFMYAQKKIQKDIKSRQTNFEVKSIQVKVGTGDGDLKLKASRASAWLEDGHRVKVELYLKGRTKYMDKDFLHDRLSKVLSLVTEPYKIVEEFKDSSKGITVLIELDKKAVKKPAEVPTNDQVETAEGTIPEEMQE